jgi:glutathione S-transferase
MTYLHHHALRNGIEVRCPFLDLDLVSIALSVPARLWPPPWPGERLHREILADLLPTEVLQRRGKANFQPALVRRIRRHLPYIKDLLGSGRWVAGHFVDQAGARQLLETFEGSAAPNLETTYSLWAIATLEAWMRAVFEYDSPRRM